MTVYICLQEDKTIGKVEIAHELVNGNAEYVLNSFIYLFLGVIYSLTTL